MQSSQSILDPFSVKWHYSESIYNFFLQNSRKWQLHRKSHNRGLGWPFVLCLNLVLHWTGENIKTQASHHAKQHTGCGQQNNNKKQRTEERKKEKTDIKQATSVNLHHNINLHWSGIYCKMHVSLLTRHQSPMLQCYQHDHHSKQRSYWKLSTHHKSADPVASSARVPWEAAEDLGGSSITSALLLDLTEHGDCSKWLDNCLQKGRKAQLYTNKTHYSPELSQSGTELPCAAAAEP